MPCEHSGDIDSNCNCYENAIEAKKLIDKIEIQEFTLYKQKEAAKSTYENYFHLNKQPSTLTMCFISTLVGIFIGYKFKYKINSYKI